MFAAPWDLVDQMSLGRTAQPVRFSWFTAGLVGLLIAYSLVRMRPRIATAVTVATAAALVPLWPALSGHSYRLPPTPAFFALRVRVPRNADVLVLPYPTPPNVDALAWQMRADLRFNLVGGYSVFDNGSGHGTYRAQLPGYAAALNGLVHTGRPLTAGELAAARAQWRSSGVHYALLVPIWSPALDAKVVAATASVTGDRPQFVGGVYLFSN